jgi:uncharacterized protein YheU (UPF0270 family)
MISISKVKESIITNGERILKVLQFGAKTAKVFSDFGDDSQPLKDMIAVYADTTEVGESVIIGYLNKNQISAAGEKRIFSLKVDGSLSTDIHLKNDETIVIASGTDYAVRYSSLETSFNQLKSDFNSLVVAYNSHQHTLPNGASPPTLPGTTSAASISGAKIDEIRLP